MNKFLLLVLATLMSGCAQYQWRNTSNPSANFSVDHGVCSNEAITKIPRMVASQPAPVGTPQPSAYTTNCYREGFTNNLVCKSVPSGSSVTDMASQNAADRSRMMQQSQFDSQYQAQINQYTANCLASKGWQQFRTK